MEGVTNETEKKNINNNEFRFVGLARSGNHGIINWVLGQIPGNYCFLNCAEPKFNPFKTSRPLSEEGDTYRTNIPQFSMEKERQGDFLKKEFLLYSYEDCFLGPLNSQRFSENHLSWVGSSSYLKDILILRDPFNLFASRTKSGLIRGHYTHHGARPISILTLKRIYKQHAKEFLGRSKLLKDLLPISFNRWATEKMYRKSLAESLHLEFTDKGFMEVTGVAGGSSFDGTAYSGTAHQMRVNDRWETYATNEEYWELFDAEMADLTLEIFGEIPPVRFYQENFL